MCWTICSPECSIIFFNKKNSLTPHHIAAVTVLIANRSDEQLQRIQSAAAKYEALCGHLVDQVLLSLRPLFPSLPH